MAGRIQPRLHEVVVGELALDYEGRQLGTLQTVSQSGRSSMPHATSLCSRSTASPISPECRRLRGGRARPGKGAWVWVVGGLRLPGDETRTAPASPRPWRTRTQARGELRLQLRHRRGRSRRDAPWRSVPASKVLPGRRHRLCLGSWRHRLPAPLGIEPCLPGQGLPSPCR